MSPVNRPLWQCLRCGRRFATRNQWHSCTRLTVADCLRGKSETAVALYRAFESAVQRCGPVRVHPTKTRIAFIARMTFAGASVKRDCVEVGMYLPYRSTSGRFHKFFPYGQGGIHSLRLDSIEQIDDKVRRWLSEAYVLGMQRTPRPIPPSRKMHRGSDKASRLPVGNSKSKGRVFYIHWNEEELRQLIEPLQAAGHDVRVHWNSRTTPKWGDYLPDIVVISLERLPSHGRSYAGWIWEAKKRQRIPILFAGGAPAKVEAARSLFPEAFFCATEQVPEMVGGLIKRASKL